MSKKSSKKSSSKKPGRAGTTKENLNDIPNLHDRIRRAIKAARNDGTIEFHVPKNGETYKRKFFARFKKVNTSRVRNGWVLKDLFYAQDVQDMIDAGMIVQKRNRGLKVYRNLDIIQAMIDGTYVDTMATLVFDANGVLLDGHQRMFSLLEAQKRLDEENLRRQKAGTPITQTKVAVTLTMAMGADPRAIKYVDSHAPRTVGDRWSFVFKPSLAAAGLPVPEGSTFYNHMVTSIRYMSTMLTANPRIYTSGANKMSVDDMVAWLDKFPNTLEIILSMHYDKDILFTVPNLIQTSMAVAFRAYTFWNNHERAGRFWGTLTGEVCVADPKNDLPTQYRQFLGILGGCKTEAGQESYLDQVPAKDRDGLFSTFQAYHAKQGHRKAEILVSLFLSTWRYWLAGESLDLVKELRMLLHME